jgi:anti-sigma regulatory factor (Ser/Thr protein kinase)
MAEPFYPFTEPGADDGLAVTCACRIAVYDDAAAAPRVVVVEPADVRTYLENITQEVSRLVREQGGRVPFMVIREVVENFIHAYFTEPTISILDGGDTIRFSDQGPGIKDKDLAMEFGTSSATAGMKRYIRGVGSGLPYAQQYMLDHGGTLSIEDNIGVGTVVTLSLAEKDEADGDFTFTPQAQAQQQPAAPQAGWGYPPQQAPWPQQPGYQPQPAYQQQYPQPYPQPWQQPQPRQTWQQPYQQPWPDATVALDDREKAILDYLMHHESVGPTDLVAQYGPSQATWSRKLTQLEQRGFLTKHGQKRYLSDTGRAWAHANLPQG